MARLIRFLELLTSPVGIVLAAIILVYITIHLTRRETSWLSLIIIFAVSGMSSINVYSQRTGSRANFMPGLEQLRHLNYPLVAALSFLIMLSFIGLTTPSWRKPFSATLATFFIFKYYYLARQFTLGRDAVVTLLAAIVFAMLWLAAFAIAKRLQSAKDIHRLYVTIQIGILGYMLMSMMQFLYNPGVITWAGRFMGLSSHPNFTGVLLAVTAPVTAYLINASLSRKKMLIFWSVVAGLQAVLIVWAGSRTGALAALFGVMLVFRHRLNRLVVFGAVVVGMGLVVSLLFGEQVSQINTTRTLNTGASGRFELWQTMIAGFLRSPLIGTNEFDGSENSYLVVLVRTGIIGTSLMVAFLIAYLSQLFRIYQSYNSLQNYKPTFDCVLGISGACLLSAVFEGWLQDVVATPILMLIMGSVILGVLDNVRVYAVENEYGLQTKPMQAYA